MAKDEAKIATDEEIAAAAEVILRAKYPIALTGAGMSVESGIPPFRGPGGLWTKYGEPPMNQFQRFMENPKKAWEERLSRQNDELFKPLKVAEPNPGHHAFAELEAMGVLKFVITQNVDDLHRQAGQKALAEIHGNWKLMRCLNCVARFSTEEISLEVLPPVSQVRRDGESRYGVFRRADSDRCLMRCQDHSARADLVIVAGTSATVYPAAGFAIEVKQRGGVLVEVNLYESEITAYCNISLRGGSANVLPRLTRAISEKRRTTLS